MGSYAESWCQKRKVTPEEKGDEIMQSFFSAMDAYERQQDMRLVSVSQKAELRLAQLRGKLVQR